MPLPIFQVDAFTNQLFQGNPAAVVPLEQWLPDTTLQLIARENNLAETAFFVPAPGQADRFHLRWFTPAIEVRLCGHATLATAYTIFNCLKINQSSRLTFDSLSGPLTVEQDGDFLTLDFPADRAESTTLPDQVLAAFGIQPRSVWRGRDDFMLVFDSEADILALNPDFRALKSVATRGFICTAPGSETDFVSRCFFPGAGIDEDPVTGSAHTVSTPYWAGIFNKNQLRAAQLSERRGYLECTLIGDRVLLRGQGKLYLRGEFFFS
jgi:PhzF family phenazine biosynthesis protein